MAWWERISVLGTIANALITAPQSARLVTIITGVLKTTPVGITQLSARITPAVIF
jgi:hypothetical protein